MHVILLIIIILNFSDFDDKSKVVVIEESSVGIYDCNWLDVDIHRKESIIQYLLCE